MGGFPASPPPSSRLGVCRPRGEVSARYSTEVRSGVVVPRICRIGGVFLWAKSGFLKKKVLFWRRNKSPEVESAGFPCMENPGRGIQSVICQLRRDRKEPQRTPSDFPVFLAITCVHLKNDLFFESKVRRFLVAKQSKVAVFAWDFSPVSKEQVKSAWIWRPIPGLCVCPVADPAGSACRSCRICTGSADPAQDLQQGTRTDLGWDAKSMLISLVPY